jgi:hypothetical protein
LNYRQEHLCQEFSNVTLLTVLQDLDADEAESKEETAEVDPKNLKVTELRAELSARNLSTKGE